MTAVMVGESAAAGVRLRRLHELSQVTQPTTPEVFAVQLAEAARLPSDTLDEVQVKATLFTEALIGARDDLPVELATAVTAHMGIPQTYFVDASIAAQTDIDLINTALQHYGVTDVFLCRGGKMTPAERANGLALALSFTQHDEESEADSR